MTATTPIFTPHGTSNIAVTSSRAAYGVMDGVRDLVASFKDRRQVRQMLELDDRILSDIGLERSDIRAALAKPYPVRPSDTLQETRRTRHEERLARLLRH